MKIIGAAYTRHDQSICLIEDDKIIFHIEYERISRIKHNLTSDFNISETLKDFEVFANSIIEDVNPDIIAISGMGYDESFNIIVPQNVNLQKIINGFYPNDFNDFVLRKSDNKLFYYIDHHIAHGAYSFYTSGFDEGDKLIYDGGGEKFYSIFVNKDNKITDVNSLDIGIMWSYLAFKTLGFFAPGKIMGLAAYGKISDKYLKIFNSDVREFKILIDKEEKELNNNFEELMDAAATLQYVSIEKTLKVLSKNKSSDNLCIAGGVGLNGYINQEIDRKLYKNVYIPPSTGDGGISIGCALHAYYNILDKKIDKNIAYLGKKYKIPEIGEEYSYDDLYSYIAQKISEGKVVGWYQGRSESGPRALGNRSILADPRDPNMKDHINNSVKHREWFRPFAPAILKEHVTEWFENIEEARYMLKIARYKKGMGEKVPAVCHIDYTGRLQTVTEEDNRHFYNLIKAFYDITGIPILLNTSFNDNTEPIVETPEDAIKTFKNNNIDILVLGNRVIYNNG